MLFGPVENDTDFGNAAALDMLLARKEGRLPCEVDEAKIEVGGGGI